MEFIGFMLIMFLVQLFTLHLRVVVLKDFN